MFTLFNFKLKKAQKLHEQGQALSDQGRDDEAIEKYKAAIELDPGKSESYYNIGLIFKYRNNWPESFKYNQKAYELDPEDEAARWNLGIAATALQDWATARRAWLDNGIELDDTEGPIQDDFGITPVRLDPDGNAEVVWAQRIDPARAKIESVPLPDSGFCSGDIVLNDGAPVGYRKYGDSERPVFNVLELVTPSELSTYQAVIQVSEQADIDQLEEMLLEKDVVMEDWTSNFRILCKACSEGRPYDDHEHDHDLEKQWVPEHKLGIAASSLDLVEEVMQRWTANSSRQLLSLECVLTRNA